MPYDSGDVDSGDELEVLLSERIESVRDELIAKNEREMRALLGEHIHEIKGEIHQEVSDKIQNMEALDGALNTLSAASSLLFAAPVPSQATCLSYIILLALISSQVIQGVLTYKLYNNAKAPDRILLRNFLLEGWLDLEEGWGRQNYTSLGSAVDAMGVERAHSNWGVVPDSHADNYTSCHTIYANTHHKGGVASGNSGEAAMALGRVVGSCRNAMADDFESTYLHLCPRAPPCLGSAGQYNDMQVI